MKFILHSVRTYHSHHQYLVEASSQEEALDKWNDYDYEEESIGSHGLLDMDYDMEEFQSCEALPDPRCYEARVNSFVLKVVEGVSV